MPRHRVPFSVLSRGPHVGAGCIDERKQRVIIKGRTWPGFEPMLARYGDFFCPARGFPLFRPFLSGFVLSPLFFLVSGCHLLMRGRITSRFPLEDFFGHGPPDAEQVSSIFPLRNSCTCEFQAGWMAPRSPSQGALQSSLGPF